MKVLVSGSSGLIGSALLPVLVSSGHQVIRLRRAGSRLTSSDDIVWDPEGGHIDAASLGGIEAVVHLAGENIATGRWTEAKKARIRISRVQGTRLLCEALAALTTPPRVIVCASAIGYYGHRGDELLSEESVGGFGFLAEICRDWEGATEPAVRRGLRVVNLRIGVVLSRQGGALAKMLPLFIAGLGGPVGRGEQYWSWVAIDDVVGTIHHALLTDSLRGPVNVVAPNPATNRQFTKILAQVLKRPALLPVPPVALRLLLSEMAEELLLCSARVTPAKLLATGYTFHYPDLEEALRHLLGRGSRNG